MKTKYQLIEGGNIKSSILWDEDSDAWVYMSGQPQAGDGTPQKYYRILPTLYRATKLRSRSVAGLPFAIMRGETEVTTSDDWEDPTGVIPDMKKLLRIIEACLTLAGRAYLKQDKNIAGYTKLLRHYDPWSVSLDEDKLRANTIEFIRTDTQTRHIPADEIIYFWYEDPSVELGPPTAWPAQAALNACGVLSNVDEFAKKFFASGALRTMLFAMDGVSKDDAEMFEKWWQRAVAGIRNAFGTKVINAQKVAPVVVGEGIKELEHVTINAEKREDIAAALDIPFTILFSNAANYATAERDKLNWYEDFVIPEFDFIAGVLNEQLFTPLGMKMVNRSETLDIFQEDEADRSTQLVQLVSALEEPEKFLVASKILGYELDPDVEKMIADLIAAKEKAREEMAQQTQLAPVAPGQQPEPEDDADQVQPPAKSFDPQLERELSIWQSKCIAAIKRGKTADSVSFVPIVCSATEHSRIMAGLKSAQDVEQVKAAFAAKDEIILANPRPYMMTPEMIEDGKLWHDMVSKMVSNELLLEAIKSGVDALKVTA